MGTVKFIFYYGFYIKVFEIISVMLFDHLLLKTDITTTFSLYLFSVCIHILAL
jgi:hypothetical protein